MTALEWAFVVALAYGGVMTGLFALLWSDRDFWRNVARHRRRAQAAAVAEHTALLMLLARQGIYVVSDEVDVTDLERAETPADIGWSEGR
ncbi:MAG TPA: hypothetical protein VFJ19_08950 [Nocardioidaceae bacterium]|nr:hypothetical protein [Nocardioidaceae bacterium]